jgi:hypothetical protein
MLRILCFPVYSYFTRIQDVLLKAYTHRILKFLTFVVSCGPDGERILDVVPGGTELVLALRRGVGRAATLAIIHTPSVLEFIKHK